VTAKLRLGPTAGYGIVGEWIRKRTNGSSNASMRRSGRAGTSSSPTTCSRDDYVRHDLRPTHAPPGAAGQAQIAEAFRGAFPDLQWRVDLLLAEGDLVAARWTASRTHMGRWGEIAPTGRRAEFSGVNIFRFGPNGKVVEIWNHRDDLGLREQLDAPVYAGAPSQQDS
jgi:predicted ester cyclase